MQNEIMIQFSILYYEYFEELALKIPTRSI